MKNCLVKHARGENKRKENGEKVKKRGLKKNRNKRTWTKVKRKKTYSRHQVASSGQF